MALGPMAEDYLQQNSIIWKSGTETPALANVKSRKGFRATEPGPKSPENLPHGREFVQLVHTLT